MEKENVVYIHNGVMIQPGERMKSCHLWQHGGPWVKWTKSDKEKQMPYDLTYMLNPKINKQNLRS